jgi:hypothetical protein
MFIVIAYHMNVIKYIYGPFEKAKDAHGWTTVVNPSYTCEVHQMLWPTHNAD